MTDLLAIARKPDAQRAIDRCRERGVYDDGRRIREHGPDTVAVPVTDETVVDPVVAVIEDTDPDPRRRGLDDVLRARGFDEAEIERAPASWAVIGDVIVADFDGCDRPEAVGEALLTLHGGAETVLDRDGVTGAHREPDVTVVAGTGDTETVHVEHGTAYGLDLAEVMFSPGNKAERARTLDAVDPDESVLDMFAGIGYFALPAARAGADVLAVERNPTAFRYLVSNARRNGVADRVRPVLADCRDVIERRDRSVDRVLMGHYDAPEYLDHALDALAPGGTLVCHATTPDGARYERPVERLRATAERPVTVIDRRTVKSHSAGVWHVVIEARVG